MDSELVDVKVNHTYYIEVQGGPSNHWVMGKLVSKAARFRGVHYWAVFGNSMIHLIDPDDVIELKEVKDYA